jgi:hypothetical protein
MSVSRAPLKSGTIANAVLAPVGTVSATNPMQTNLGTAELVQSAVITQNSTAAVSCVFYIPALSLISSFSNDVLVAFDSVTSATLSVGATAGGTEYVSGVDVKTTGRIAATHTAAQLLAMSSTAATTQTANVNAYSAVYATITVVGATTAGTVRVTIRYVNP